MKLQEALFEATKECNHEVEEEGGIIIHDPSTPNSFEFIKITNQNAGTKIAPVLWTADRQEYADKIIPRFAKGMRHYASFHTHPRFLPIPSNVDLTQLFPGFSINYIYSQVSAAISEWKTDKEFLTDFSAAYNVNEFDVEEKDPADTSWQNKK